jgi:hypothetical protein
MSEETVSLKSLMTPSKTVTIKFPGYEDFFVDVCYLAREELLKLRKRCVTTKFNRKTHIAEEVLDDEKFLTEYTAAVIKGWKGLKFSYLEEFLLVDISKLNPDDELPYTEDNAELMMKNSNSFDSWITEVGGDLQNFTGNK